MAEEDRSTTLEIPQFDPELFKDTKGRWRTQSLFLETLYNPAAIYTMKRKKHRGRPSFPELYVQLCDPTDYAPATQLLGGWSHWMTLEQSEWFKDFINPLREEVEVKLRSEAIRAIGKVAKAGGKSALPAAKFLADGNFTGKRRVGRPSREEVKDEARKMAKIRDNLMRDAEAVEIH